VKLPSFAAVSNHIDGILALPDILLRLGIAHASMALLSACEDVPYWERSTCAAFYSLSPFMFVAMS